MRKVSIYLLLSVLAMPYAKADNIVPQERTQQQATTFQGVVTDEKGEGEVGAIITVKGTNIKAVTDLDGMIINRITTTKKYDKNNEN